MILLESLNAHILTAFQVYTHSEMQILLGDLLYNSRGREEGGVNIEQIESKHLT